VLDAASPLSVYDGVAAEPTTANVPPLAPGARRTS